MNLESLSHPSYHDETEARKYLENLRWPDEVSCPYCGGLERIAALGGRSMGEGWWHCGDCRRKFTVRVGTIFERSHIPLHKWLLAFRLMASSKKGISAHQLHRTLGITYKSAWFMAHRIRESMKGTAPGSMGGHGKIVEADETLYGNSGYEFVNEHGWQKKKGGGDMSRVVTVVERNGRARSQVVKDVRTESVRSVLIENIDPASTLMTDEAKIYKTIGKEFRKHRHVNHSKGEYVRGLSAYTNTVEGYFSIFKRGMIGTYQHCGEQHLQRYLNEFDFRYTHRKITDAERTTVAVKGAEGKRLTYRRPNNRAAKAKNHASAIS